ncbi:hypothetical protein TrRE_jg4705 [Triparma retinervis]|uniref:ADP,ATP carrier protein n=1 Tax=Triparma retinervis TaxID=2557542 RepID=A0A9W7EAI2_9STRA|nr:hypothetical protein TrRE_jg4705 [Triparma retinervis]
MVELLEALYAPEGDQKILTENADGTEEMYYSINVPFPLSTRECILSRRKEVLGDRCYLMTRSSTSVLARSIRKNPLRSSIALSFVLASTLCSFWILDSVKDVVLSSTVGIEQQPTAKIISLAATFGATCAYNVMVNKIRSSGRGMGLGFYAISLAYTLAWLAVLGLPGWGRGPSPPPDPAVGSPEVPHVPATEADPPPAPWVGYLVYVLTESYGSLMVMHFWGYVNSRYALPDAERYYGAIVGGAQVGAVGGGAIVRAVGDVRACVAIGGVAGNGAVAVMVMGTLYEVTMTVLDYELKVLSVERYDSGGEGEDSGPQSSGTTLDIVEMSRFMGGYAVLVNGTSLLVSVLVFPRVLKRLGVTMALRVFPCLLVGATLMCFIYPSLGMVFVSMGVLKALAYSLNDPLKELLYQPTTDKVKYNAKSWVDVVGSRLAKGVGSVVARQGGRGEGGLMKNAALPCLGVSIVMGAVSVKVGEVFKDYVERGVRVGEDGGGGGGYEKVEGGRRDDMEGVEEGGGGGGAKGVELVSL